MSKPNDVRFEYGQFGDRLVPVLNERRIRALLELARSKAVYDTRRHTETLACSFVRDNLAFALGIGLETDLVMDEERVESLLQQARDAT